MNKNILLIAFIALSLLVFGACRAEENATSDESNPKEETQEVKSESKKNVPERTVADTTAVLDMLDYLDVELVGVPETERDIKDKYKETPNIGKPMTPDMELLKSVDPDMYVSVTSLEESLKKQLEENEIESVFLENSSYDSILDSMNKLGGYVW